MCVRERVCVCIICIKAHKKRKYTLGNFKPMEATISDIYGSKGIYLIRIEDSINKEDRLTPNLILPSEMFSKKWQKFEEK